MSPLPNQTDLRRVARRLASYNAWILRAVQLAFFVFGAISAFMLRFDFNIPRQYHQHLWFGLALTRRRQGSRLPLARTRSRMVAYSSVPDLLRLAAGNTIGSALACLALLILAPPGFPRSLYFLDFLLCLVMTGGIRVVVRVVAESSRLPNGQIRKRTLICGAGDAGVSLLREIHHNSALSYDVLGFVDDNPAKSGMWIHRTRVFGNGAALPAHREGPPDRDGPYRDARRHWFPR